MRTFIATAVLCAALGGPSALAEMQANQSSTNLAPPFAEDGVFIPAGETVEVVIDDKCHRFTNRNRQIAMFFSPSKPGSWPSDSDMGRASLEPKVTEEPCK